MLENTLDPSYLSLVNSSKSEAPSGSVTNDREARDVARQFEALLIQTMLKNMRSATPSGGLFDSKQADMYMEMFDQKISEEISKTSSFGLQESIFRQLTGRGIIDRADRGLHTANVRMNPSPVRSPSAEKSDFISPNPTPAGFIDRLRASAAETARKLGTTMEAVVAVAALETGWGKRVATTEDGRSTHNLFGIKSGPDWQGESRSVMTREFREGELRPESAAFRVYRSEHESIQDFGRFLLENPRYQAALQVASKPEQFIRELQRAGYATDPDYAEKVISTMRSVSDIMDADKPGPR